MSICIKLATEFNVKWFKNAAQPSEPHSFCEKIKNCPKASSINCAALWNEMLQDTTLLNVTHMQFSSCNGKKNCPNLCQQGHLHDPINDICKTRASKWQACVGSCKECKTTCFTPHAMQQNSTCPWRNVSLEREFHSANKQQFLENKAKDQNQGMRERRNHTCKPRFQCDVTRNQTRLTLPLSIQSTFEHHLCFPPKCELTFCGVPKWAMTEWRCFF